MVIFTININKAYLVLKVHLVIWYGGTYRWYISVVHTGMVIEIKKTHTLSGEIQDFVETPICKLRAILNTSTAIARTITRVIHMTS